MSVGDIVIIISDDNNRFFKGDKVKILGYSPTYNQYYVQRAEGQLCSMVNKEDVRDDR